MLSIFAIAILCTIIFAWIFFFVNHRHLPHCVCGYDFEKENSLVGFSFTFDVLIKNIFRHKKYRQPHLKFFMIINFLILIFIVENLLERHSTKNRHKRKTFFFIVIDGCVGLFVLLPWLYKMYILLLNNY